MIRIVMCTYNGERFIDEQIASIMKNTKTDWQLYISDDKSTDKTVSIVKSYQQKFPQKILFSINYENKGVAIHFLNKIKEIGQEMDEEDFIMLCDQDDVWYSNKIEITLKYMRELIAANSNQVPLLVCSDVEVVNENLEQIYASFWQMNHYNIKNLDFAHLLMENKVQGCTVMINQALAKKITQIPANVTMHDSWIGLIAASMGRIKYIPHPTMAYRQHQGNVKGTISYRKIILDQIMNLREQKYVVYKSAAQIKEFIKIYEKELDDNIKEIATAFINLENNGFFKKRADIIKYHMWKTGIPRNLGIMVLL